MPRRFRLLADIEPLRQSPAFRRLWAGTTLSSVGGALTYFALSLQVFRLTHSSFAVGALGLFGAAIGAGGLVSAVLSGSLRHLARPGRAMLITVVFRGAILQEVTPDPLRGRVMAADYVGGAGGAQVGNLEAGALGSLTTPVISALAGGLATMGGALIPAVALPGFYRYRWTGDGGVSGTTAQENPENVVTNEGA